MLARAALSHRFQGSWNLPPASGVSAASDQTGTDPSIPEVTMRRRSLLPPVATVFAVVALLAAASTALAGG